MGSALVDFLLFIFYCFRGQEQCFMYRISICDDFFVTEECRILHLVLLLQVCPCRTLYLDFISIIFLNLSYLILKSLGLDFVTFPVACSFFSVSSNQQNNYSDFQPKIV